MAVEAQVGFAEGVEAGFAGGSDAEAVLGAFAVAGEEIPAVKAFFRERVALVHAESDLRVRVHHGPEIVGGDVPEPVAGIHEMVAGIDVPVVLDDGITPAGAVVYADAGSCSAPRSQGCIELSHKHFSHIALYPVIEDFAEELPEPFGADRPFSGL